MCSIPPSKLDEKGRPENLLFTKDKPIDRNKHWLRVKNIYKLMAPQNRQK
jgi:hypothetical protein